jgi:hypothetical protein
MRLARFGAALAVGAIAVGLIGGCSKTAPVSNVTQTAYRFEGKEPPPPVPPTWPLTGMVGELTDRPALAVKIENSPAARPQTGLDQADLVWEELVEGGGTRFVAVFNSLVPESVGPVRSARPMDGPILGPTHGLLACSGGQVRFITAAQAAGLQVFTEDYKGFYRSPDRRSPNNLYLRPTEVWEQADVSHKALPQPEFEYAAFDAAATPLMEGVAVGKLTVVISPVAKPTWTWDEAAWAFLRSEGSTPSLAVSGERLGAENVVVLRVQVQDAGGTDSAGSPIPETKIVGSGSGVVATGGKAVEVQWSKKDIASPIQLTTTEGKPVQLATGQTWIELVPESGGSWTLT